MKFIHTSDLHLGSPLTARLSPERIEIRKRELLNTFYSIIDLAKTEKSDAIIIAGDLFDSDNCQGGLINNLLSAISSAPSIEFLYLPGNHEGDLLLRKAERLPQNLKVFGKEWTYYNIKGVTFAGRSEIDQESFDKLKLDKTAKNVVVLHGALTDLARNAGEIGIRNASGRGIDYLALGHYHKYSSHKLDERGTAVYCGTPEGRGFDEAHPCGVVIAETGDKLCYKFVETSKRKIREIEFNLSQITDHYSLECKLLSALKGYSDSDIIRVSLVGEKDLELNVEVSQLKRRLPDFFHLEIRDLSRLKINLEDYARDKSLKGEFIREVLTCCELTEEMKERILLCGLNALLGEEIGN